LGISYQFGWKSLAEYVGCCEKTIRKQKSALMEQGVIDFPLKGRPPKRVMRWKADLFDEFRENNKKS
jgi:hypothetical protein